VAQTDVLTAPVPAALKAKMRVRVAFDNELIGAQVWQYGIIRWVHAGQLLDINLDGGGGRGALCTPRHRWRCSARLRGLTRQRATSTERTRHPRDNARRACACRLGAGMWSDEPRSSRV